MKPRYLLDTSVFSQPLRNKPVLRSLERWQAAGDSRCRVSAVSVAEVEFGLHLEASSSRWLKYDALLRGRLEVLPTDLEVWEEFARRKARQQTLGRVVADLDLLIAAAAAHHGFIVATLNTKDFQKIEGLAWENWGE